MNTAAFQALVRKDLLLFVRDRRALLLNLAAPVVIAAFFGFVFGGASKSEKTRIPVAVVDLDGSVLSKKIVAGLAADPALALAPMDEAAARESVRKGKSSAGLVLPKGFGEAAGAAFFVGGTKPSVQLLVDPSRSAEPALVRGLLTQHAMEQVSAEMFAGEQGQRQMDAFLGQVAATKPAPGSEDADLQGLLIQTKKWNARQSAKPAAERKGAGGMSVPYELKEEAIQSGKLAYNSFGHSFAGMGVQFILFMGIEAGVGILLARRSGLWKRLRAAPVSRGLLLGARTTSTAILATGLLGAIFLIARLLFGVRIEGSLLGFGVLALAFGALVGTFGLLIAALGRTPEATRGLAIFVTLVLVMLGGAWIPAFLFPAWVQKLTLLAPTRWAIDGLDGVIWRGYTFAETLPAIGAVAAFALLFGVLAVWRFRWEEG